MLFDAIFISLFVSGWLACGFAPWLLLSVATRGGAGLVYLPLSLFTALVVGLAIPVLGADGSNGIWLSFAGAIVAPSILLSVRRFSLHGAAHAPTPSPEHLTK